MSPTYLTATPGNAANGSYGTSDAIAVTPLVGNGSATNFYVVRQGNFTSTANVTYQITVSTSAGEVTLPQLGGVLSLNGRDSKILVTDYDLGGINLIYSTADIFTWAKGSGSRRILILYGGAGETHEFAVPTFLGIPTTFEGNGAVIQNQTSTIIVQWQVSPVRQVLSFADGELEVHLLWRNDAYNYWVMELPAAQPIGNYTSPSKQSVIVKAGYLIRTASLSGNQLSLTGDINTTTEIEVISTPTTNITSLTFNGKILNTYYPGKYGRPTAVLNFSSPSISIPNLSTISWKSIDSLPEIQPSYDDSAWTSLTHLTTNKNFNDTSTT